MKDEQRGADEDRPASGSPQTRPPYWMPAGLTLVFLVPAWVAAASLPWLADFRVYSTYGPTYAWYMYLAAITLPVAIHSGLILLSEALVRFLPTEKA